MRLSMVIQVGRNAESRCIYWPIYMILYIYVWYIIYNIDIYWYWGKISMANFRKLIDDDDDDGRPKHPESEVVVKV
jgi:hypothetical protein